MKCPKCGEEIFDMGVTVFEILHDDKVPEGTKNLICPLLGRLKGFEREVAGAIELAYRRGQQENDEGANP